MVSGMVQWYQGVLVSTSCIGAGILVCDLQWKFGFGSGQGCHASASSYRPGLDSPEAASSGRLCDLKRVGFKGHMTPIRPSFGSCNKVQSLNLSSGSRNTNSGLGSPWSMHDKKLSHRGTLSKLEEGHLDKKNIGPRQSPHRVSKPKAPYILPSKISDQSNIPRPPAHLTQSPPIQFQHQHSPWARSAPDPRTRTPPSTTRWTPTRAPTRFVHHLDNPQNTY